MDLSAMSDDDFYQHAREVKEEASRRTRRTTLPGELAAMVHDATDAGIANDDVRATVETALNGENS